VHVGQHDLEPVAARKLIGPEMHLGLSVSSDAELAGALALPPGTVDLLGVGPVRDTPSKIDASPALGFDGLARICAASPLPCVAIGGLGVGDVVGLMASGAVGVAVISAICGRADPLAAARDLATAWVRA
jgi:thiamine-phosphate diphosphorylase